MDYWFGTVTPPRVLLHFGGVEVYWYSICIALGILAALLVARAAYRRTHGSDAVLIDAAFWAIIGGLIGARLWHVFVFQWQYYAEHLGDVVKIWEGGIAIQGALAGGAIALIVYSRLKKVGTLLLTDYMALGLPLGQAIGRWGNFFNQELYGGPTGLPWGIFIDPRYRLPEIAQHSHFHPVFLYESLLNLLFFALLWIFAKQKRNVGEVTGAYLIGYGVIRFVVDFFRIDPMPDLGPLRLSQLVSIGFMIFGTTLIFIFLSKKKVRSSY